MKHRKLTFPGVNRAVDEWLFQFHTSIIYQVTRFEIISAIDD